MRTKPSGYAAFERLLGKIVRVPAARVKDAIAAERAAKQKKRKPRASASRASSDQS